VYAFGDALVLRTYRAGGDVSAEAAIMRHVGRHGFPVPEVHGAGGRDLWLERLDGPTMLAAVEAGAVGVTEGAGILADLHRRLHALPPPDGTAPGDRVLHLDLHPANVMLPARGPVVIDWRNARTGPPDLDVALSALILAQGSLDPGLPAIAGLARAALAPFLRAAGGDPLSELDGAVAMRRADPNLSEAETGRLAAARRLIMESAR
jgi:hypothetical protein